MHKRLTRYPTRPRICFVTHLAYGALTGGASGFVGGVERQTSLMAKWFAARGYSASMLTWDEGQQDGVEIDGVRVFRMCRKEAGVKGLRFFWPKWTSLVAAMKRADADVYYQNCGEYVTGQVAVWCRRHGRKFVYSVANDTDCDVRLPEMNKLRERILYRYGLKAADKIVVQTRRQQEMLQSGFGHQSEVIPMPCPGPSDEEYGRCEQGRDGSQRVLWIGRICEQKRPDRLLDLAEICREVDFDLVGPQDGTQYARQVCERAKSIPNVTLHGPAVRERVPELYKKALLMCCTSDFEGFPNTFLEAWSWGLPIISTFDPDGLIAEQHMGASCQDVQEVASQIRALLTDEKQLQRASDAARRYYVQNHTVESVMPRFDAVFRDVSKQTPTVGSRK